MTVPVRLVWLRELLLWKLRKLTYSITFFSQSEDCHHDETSLVINRESNTELEEKDKYDIDVNIVG